ncbi:MAG: HAD hydrolase-like protein [Brevinematales bacterium]|nr:HAD hydrolase-like protein [Brevinematales bacterium]
MVRNAYLFDIDGTLLHARGLGKWAFENALSKILGKNFSLEKEDFSGRTDKDILYSFLERLGYKKQEIDNFIPLLYETYLFEFKELSEKNKEMFLVFPKVYEILSELKGECIGLLTGNLLESAFIKLKAVGLSDFFPYGVGGFGNESRNRSKLFPIAIERMKNFYKVNNFNKIWIIGDSHRDIICAKENNALSLIVATGKEKKEKLITYKPDYIFNDFSDTKAILNILKYQYL